ncbi:MAG: hypothetical protein KDB45_15165 [Mycobacterium sp.]|nr:hypothetical protein [Mycobacterium sp.]
MNKQEFQAWAFDNLLANTTRGLLAEYIVATATGALAPRREWNQYDLKVGDIGVEVKSAAYVQAWKQAQPSVISFDIGLKTGWDAETDTRAAGPCRSADVYVFCLLKEKDLDRVKPLDVEQWTFYVLATSVLNRERPVEKTIRLEPLKALGAKQCTYDGLKAAIEEVAEGQPRRPTTTLGPCSHSPLQDRVDINISEAANPLYVDP